MYKQYEIGYKLNGEEKKQKYWASLEMERDLAVVIIFSYYFGRKYNAKRIDAENDFVEKGKCSYSFYDKKEILRKYEFSDLSFKQIDSREIKERLQVLFTTRQENERKKGLVVKVTKEITGNVFGGKAKLY